MIYYLIFHFFPLPGRLTDLRSRPTGHKLRPAHLTRRQKHTNRLLMILSAIKNTLGESQYFSSKPAISRIPSLSGNIMLNTPEKLEIGIYFRLPLTTRLVFSGPEVTWMVP